ncbi:hypothetical protein FHT19_003938 [Novosphingobium sp. SG919]|nr:hypothetical protein [Novosphingobium sp. SG919]
MPVEIRRTIVPPDRPTLAERPLRLVDGLVRLILRDFVLVSPGSSDCAARGHQLRNQLCPLLWWQ